MFENNLLTRFVSCSVRSCVIRPSPKLASSRLRQRLFGAATSQTSRRKPCYRQYDLFSNHYGCSYLHTTCTSNITHFICTWANRIHTTKVWALLFLHKWKQLLILHFSNNFQYFYKIATISRTILLYICSRMLLAFLLQGAHHTSHDIFFCAHLI